MSHCISALETIRGRTADGPHAVRLLARRNVVAGRLGAMPAAALPGGMASGPNGPRSVRRIAAQKAQGVLDSRIASNHDTKLDEMSMCLEMLDV